MGLYIGYMTLWNNSTLKEFVGSALLKAIFEMQGLALGLDCQTHRTFSRMKCHGNVNSRITGYPAEHMLE